MSERQVRLSCGHYIFTTGDRTQPIKVNEFRWCGQCRGIRGWRWITKVFARESAVIGGQFQGDKPQ